MTVSAKQIEIARSHGALEVELIARCCNETGARLYIALAMLEKETFDPKTGTFCRNVYGHDVGGTFRGFKDPVSECNWRAFRHEVITNGRPSNGVGPSQLTFKGFFTDMEAKGLKPWDMFQNISYGIKLIQSYYRAGRDQGKSVSESLRYAGLKYNGSEAYGDAFLAAALKWKERVGSDDYA